MRISAITPYYQNNQYKIQPKPAFSGLFSVGSPRYVNIGMAEEGIVGKLRVFDQAGREKFLNLVKDIGPSGFEIYMLKDNFGSIIGEMMMKIKKAPNMNDCSGDECWVWVDYLRNYSRPNTKWTQKGLSEHKAIGTRLLQIAQRRSDETGCCGNIHLCTKEESREFYKRLGFKEIPTLYDYKQDNLYLPAEAKEPLSKLHGGLWFY